MMEPEAIFAAVGPLLNPERADLAGRRVVVSAGGTREALDPVRFIGNASSGKQGFALARAAAARGADVAVVAANVELPTPPGVRRADVVSALDLRQMIESLAGTADVIIQTAAVADYRPGNYAPTKVKRADAPDGLNITLVPNPDVLAELVAARRPGQVIVGFAAETGDSTRAAMDYARAKAKAKGTDLTVANVVADGAVFGQDTNDVVVLDAEGNQVAHKQGSKDQVADAILDAVVAYLART
jgi:phosphopantothenoylcysteine decarboxylase/phosphopantothenate--cysteine ligase